MAADKLKILSDRLEDSRKRETAYSDTLNHFEQTIAAQFSDAMDMFKELSAAKDMSPEEMKQYLLVIIKKVLDTEKCSYFEIIDNNCYKIFDITREDRLKELHPMEEDLILLQAEETKLFSKEFFDLEALTNLVIRFSFNLLVVGIIVRGLYYTLTRKKNYLFSFMLIGTIVFLICFLLPTLDIGWSFALVLFAIFAIIRYRTNPIPIKEMTYLFIVIGVSVINGLSSKDTSYLELVFTNIIVKKMPSLPLDLPREMSKSILG